nr:nucleotide sugar dehydrogenase [Candidatus Sigynarchaeota archaeon]
MRTICVLGMGYIGLPTAVMFANAGFEVHGVDVKEDVIASLARGKVHFEEPGLADALTKAINTSALFFHSKPVAAETYILCVPTPLNSEKRANLDYVVKASESIIPVISKNALVILESTVPPRTCLDVVKPILERAGMKVGTDISLAFCPERVIPNNILIEIVENDRICGGIDEISTKRAKDIYKSFVKGDIHETDCTTAEIVKLMENTFRDVNIALANEFEIICETLGINVWEAIRLANKHPRVTIHQPGPGVGGHCIPVVPWFIVEKDETNSKLIQVARGINDKMPGRILKLVGDHVDLSKNPVITIWGVAFKPNTDDTSLSPATDIIKLLEGAGAVVKVHDPLVKAYIYPIMALEESIDGSECIIIITNHDYYTTVDLSMISRKMKKRQVIDTRNTIKAKDWSLLGFKCVILGNPVIYDRG